MDLHQKNSSIFHKNTSVSSSFLFLLSIPFFRSSNHTERSCQRQHKQPYSKINTAILCVFTFHSAVSICDSAPQTVLALISCHEQDLFLGPWYRWTGEIAERYYSPQSYFISSPRGSCCSFMAACWPAECQAVSFYCCSRNMFMKTVYFAGVTRG